MTVAPDLRSQDTREKGLNEIFEVAAGSMIGRDHLGKARTLLGKNNQDAFSVSAHPDRIVAIVCDGCGSGEHSEVGAQIVCKLVSERINFYFQKYGEEEFCTKVGLILERVRQDILAHILMLANNMGSSLSVVVNEYWLCTIVGLVITHNDTLIFSLGDGVYGFNYEFRNMGPFPGNQPPYLAYGLVETSLRLTSPASLQFVENAFIPTNRVDCLMIGTDGVNDLRNIQGRTIPGTDKVISAFEELFSRDILFSNPDGLRRYLSMLNAEVAVLDRQQCSISRDFGLLPDDTTLILVRRRQAVED